MVWYEARAAHCGTAHDARARLAFHAAIALQSAPRWACRRGCATRAPPTCRALRSASRRASRARNRIVLWTRLTGADLPAAGAGALGAGARRTLHRHRRARQRDRARRRGAQRARRARCARAGALVLVPLRGLGPAQHGGPHAHRAGGRCARRPALRAGELPALRPRPLRRLAPHRECRARPGAVRRRLHLRVRLAADGPAPPRGPGGAHAGAVPRALCPVQERPAAAGRACRAAVADGVGRPRGRQRLRGIARPGAADRLSRRSAPRPIARTGSTCRFRRRCKPTRRRHAHLRPHRLGRRWPASMRSTIASTAIRRPARATGRGGANTRAAARLPRAGRPETLAARCGAGALARGKAGTRSAPGTCWRSRP